MEKCIAIKDLYRVMSVDIFTGLFWLLDCSKASSQCRDYFLLTRLHFDKPAIALFRYHCVEHMCRGRKVARTRK